MHLLRKLSRGVDVRAFGRARPRPGMVEAGRRSRAGCSTGLAVSCNVERGKPTLWVALGMPRCLERSRCRSGVPEDDVLDFLANNMEQLGLVRDHVLAGDVNNAPFGLMLVDNAVEITLHRMALDADRKVRSWRYRGRPWEHADEPKAVLGRNFGPK